MQQDIFKHLSLLRTKKSFTIKTFFFVIVLSIVLSSFNSINENQISVKINYHIVSTTAKILNHLDSIDFKTIDLTKKKSRYHYTAARKLYKEIEYYVEYNFPFHSKYYLNAPLVNKAEMEYGYKTLLPHGFQVIEQKLFNNDSIIDGKQELALLKQSLVYIKQKSENITFKQSTIIDMLRFEIIRIMSLYINGYDSPVNKQNMSETKSILNGFTKTIQVLDASEEDKIKCNNILQKAKLYLSNNRDYDSFNRLHFILTYLKPLYQQLYVFYDSDAKNEITSFAINIRREKFYDDNWLNKKYFSVVIKDSALVSKQVEIGRLLFFDPLISGDNKRACASCHNPNNAFGGSADFNASFQSDEKLKRNTPSILNALFQKSFFYDGRSLQLEDQVSEVLTNHKEMFSNPADIVYKLKQSPEYKSYFRKAFANTEDTAITYYAILKSISEYEKTLVALNSKFDKYLKGDMSQLNKEEVNGYNIFAGKALCGSCHFFPLFNGLVPPFYSDNEFEVIGVPKNKNNKELDIDSGRYVISKNKIHISSFKTVSIRNLEQTAPYMHNGIYTTIDEVIEFYVKGGGAGLGISVPNQTLPFDSLKLTKTETGNLKKFLLSLSDKMSDVSIPKSLPVVNIKGLEIRKVGGSY